MLECEIIQSHKSTNASVIWLHGLGANGHDFSPIVPELGINQEHLRFIFPHAPEQAVTVNNGYVMPAWYDIKSADILADEDLKGTQQSQQYLYELIEAEHHKGVAYDRIIVAGFSQGGAIALYAGLRFSQKLAGIMALSCYLPLADTTQGERANNNIETPIFMAHGLSDPIVPLQAGIQSRQQLAELDYSIAWHDYPMEHSVCPEEITDIGGWIKQVLNLD